MKIDTHAHRRSLCQLAIGSLPRQLQDQLSQADRKQLLSVLNQLENRSRHLDYLPVFGYLSLRSDNYRELGKQSQSLVVAGHDVVEATLTDHGLDFVLSTVYRGTPERPGVVAGLSTREGVDTPGVLLKVPKSVRTLAAVLEREFFAESDLLDSPEGSNCQYLSYLREVSLVSGEKVLALTFLTNPGSLKAVSHRQQLTAKKLAWLMTAQGGFRRKNGDSSVKGGACFDYWVDSYLKPRRRLGQPIDPLVEKALHLAQVLPATSFRGMSPLRELQSLQKPEKDQAIVRVGSENLWRDDVGLRSA